jgi:hypothetical protein
MQRSSSSLRLASDRQHCRLRLWPHRCSQEAACSHSGLVSIQSASGHLPCGQVQHLAMRQPPRLLPDSVQPPILLPDSVQPPRLLPDFSPATVAANGAAATQIQPDLQRIVHAVIQGLFQLNLSTPMVLPRWPTPQGRAGPSLAGPSAPPAPTWTELRARGTQPFAPSTTCQTC